MSKIADKFRYFLENVKKYFLFCFILWLVFAFIFLLPTSIAIKDNTAEDGTFNLYGCITHLGGDLFKIGDNFSKLSQEEYFNYFMSILPMATLIYIVVVICALYYSKRSHHYQDIEHGSSDWCSTGEMYRVLNKTKGILLAEGIYLPVNKRGNVNVLVVGGSGSGKSTSYVFPNAFELLGSYVFTDPKGEVYDRTAGFLKSNGYDIKVLNLVKPEFSDAYNPLAHIRNEIDVDIIANTIVKGQSDVKAQDPYWDDMAEVLLKALIYFLLATRPVEEQNLASCASLVRAANSGGGDNLLTELMSQLPYDHPARMNYKSIEIAPDRTYASILSALQSKLGKFDSKEITALTSSDTIDFEAIGKKKTAIYVISPDSHTAYNFLITIFFSQMIQQLYDFADTNGGKLTVPAYFILDEFANIGQIPDFDKKISTSRSRNISFSVILQTLDQLEAQYKDTFETILSNCDTHLFLGSNSTKTVEYFSKALGEKTIRRESVSINRDKGGSKTGSTLSDQIMGRALLTPDELRRLDNDLCIIYEKGLKPIKAHKHYYFKSHPKRKIAARLEISHNDLGHVQRNPFRVFNPFDPYVDKEEDEFDKTVSDNRSKISSNNDDDYDNYDIQKELEAKFDELFGKIDDDDNNNE